MNHIYLNIIIALFLFTPCITSYSMEHDSDQNYRKLIEQFEETLAVANLDSIDTKNAIDAFHQANEILTSNMGAFNELLQKTLLEITRTYLRSYLTKFCRKEYKNKPKEELNELLKSIFIHNDEILKSVNKGAEITIAELVIAGANPNLEISYIKIPSTITPETKIITTVFNMIQSDESLQKLIPILLLYGATPEKEIQYESPRRSKYDIISDL